MTKPDYKSVIRALESGKIALDWIASVQHRSDYRADARILEAAIPLARSMVEKLERYERQKDTIWGIRYEKKC